MSSPLKLTTIAAVVAMTCNASYAFAADEKN